MGSALAFICNIYVEKFNLMVKGNSRNSEFLAGFYYSQQRSVF